VQVSDVYAGPTSAAFDVKHHALNRREEAGAGDALNIAW